MSEALLPVVALILVLGVASRVAADRLRIPSVLFLIVAGVAIGPEVLGIVDREVFGGGLSAMVGIAVAIILFEGAFRLELDRVREAPGDIARLVTLGAVVMWLGTALAVRFALSGVWPGHRWDVALLIGALLIATGPTVVTPILNVVPVRDHVAAAMETEGIVNDVTAAALAVVIFEVFVLSTGSVLGALAEFLFLIAVGLLLGAIAAGVVWWLLTELDIAPQRAPLHSRLIVLGALVASVAVAEVVAAESGITAAATMGFVLGNVEVPHEADVEEFTEDLTTIVLGFVFVALAALIDFGDVRSLGLAGVAFVVAVTLVVRPVLVFASVWNDRFTLGERAFMSLVAPRGIIPASVATLFAVELAATGAETAAQVLAGTVFLIIFATVVFQAGLARTIADALDVVPMRTIIVGGGRVGRALASRLEQDGENVVVVEDDPDAVDAARREGFRVIRGDGTDADVLAEAGADGAEAVVATTGDDDVNLLVCQLATTTFEVPEVAARVNQPANVDAFEAQGVRAIDAGLATAYSLENALERPTLSSWMNDPERAGDVREITVTAENLVGKTIGDVNAEIPDGCIVGLVSHGEGETVAPGGGHVLEAGDRVTFIGQRDAVDRAAKRFHPHE